ncbi:ABC-type dipeptide/oligopeptide/nickel transport system permease subunit [Methylopila capsulata]|uniref:ABC-type dipeptide/oligopeptide/nickel transport system permease subunit n=1 Tax=Methylopila capsulata TaxID=61654 RepID=A0A9W6IYZ6_9HYPH|nr:ABC transporter permease [Methylopila capsulata]MBM7853077.1 ABC-type dipeptide/oligopeptide/nickel transport system permease subunit [Methylopila capsulata]GLK57711.1 peptide ABC transporter permease [Methylopila capsulata]
MADVALSSPPRAAHSRGAMAWAYVRGHVWFVIAAVVVGAYVFAAAFAPFVAPFAPTEQDMMSFMAPPAWGAHLLGTDSFGQDLLSRTIYGARYALLIGLGAVAIGAGGGLVIGLAAGLIGGRVEWALMRLVDSLLALPSLIMAIAFISILGQGVDKVVLAVGVALIGPFSRTVRGDVLQVKAQPFVEAARLMGVGTLAIVWRHIIPNVIFPLAVQATIRVSYAILVSSGLSFIGIGVTPPTPDWGLMIAEGRSFVSFAPWIAGVPGAALAVLLIALSVVGDGVREQFDPKLRKEG